MRVTLSGYVVPDDDAPYYRIFGFGCFCPRDIRRAIEKNPKGEDLVLELSEDSVRILVILDRAGAFDTEA